MKCHECKYYRPRKAGRGLCKHPIEGKGRYRWFRSTCKYGWDHWGAQGAEEIFKLHFEGLDGKEKV